MEHPPFWWYLPGQKLWIFHGRTVSFREGKWCDVNMVSVSAQNFVVDRCWQNLPPGNDMNDHISHSGKRILCDRSREDAMSSWPAHPRISNGRSPSLKNISMFLHPSRRAPMVSERFVPHEGGKATEGEFWWDWGSEDWRTFRILMGFLWGCS